MRRSNWVFAGATFAVLLYLDSGFIGALFQTDILAQANVFELYVFGLQIAKMVVILPLKKYRHGSTALLVDIYGADMLVLPVLSVLYALFGYQALPGVISQIFRSWVVGAAAALLPFVAYRIARSMLMSGKLTTVLPSSLVVAEVGLLFGAAASAAVKAHSGVTGLASSVITRTGTVLVAGQDVFVAFASIYVALLLYATMGGSAKVQVNVNQALALAVIATSAGAAWTLSLNSYSSVLVYIFVPPTLVLVAASWWISHAG